MTRLKYIFLCALGCLLLIAGSSAYGHDGIVLLVDMDLGGSGELPVLSLPIMPVDSPPPNPDLGPGDPTSRDQSPNPFRPDRPSNVTTDFELAEDGQGYYVHERVGGLDVRPPSYITMQEYLEWRKQNSIADHWQKRAMGSNEAVESNALAPQIAVNSEAFKDIFGGGSVEIRPNGTAMLDLGAEFNRNGNPSLPIRQQRTGNFRFDQTIQLNVVGKIGEKLRLNANWDTQATFDFENQIKLEYTGTEDEIIQKIEAGNVSLPLSSSLIQGGQNLFGIKVGMKFGPLLVTSIASQQKGRTNSVTATGGAQVTEFRKQAIEYDEYRHFFLSHWFRSRYEYALRTRPNINSPVTITRVEVWVTNNNSSSTVENRNAVGFVDLGESERAPNPGFPDQVGRIFNDRFSGSAVYPSNDANNLYREIDGNAIYDEKASVDTALINNLQLENGVDFIKQENMRKLTPNEYKLDPRLGYISLNTQLQANQVLFVAYEYMLGSQTYQVGDFSMDPGKQANPLNSNVLFLKMLKAAQVRPTYDDEVYPPWDLMMKNIYNIGGYGITQDNFRLELMFDSRTSAGDIPVLPSGPVKNVPLLQVFGMDTLQNNAQAGPDGTFDYLQGITIQPDKGWVIFPVLEPFGSHLVRKLDNDPEEIDKYVFPQLYNSTKQDALNYATDKDRYYIQGSYQGSSSSEISLNSINVAQGSVQVTANGILLTEGIDYQVDYNIGKVTVLNSGILTSGQELNVTYETNTLFGIETKTLVGTRLDYIASEDIQLGATMLHLNERPLTNKINIGDEPLSNLIWGLDGSLRKDSKFLTKLVDKLPLLQTNEISTVTAQGEFAQLVPGHPKAIEINGEKGIAYLDDFESARTTFDLMGFQAWSYASFPGNNGNNSMFEPAGGYEPKWSSNFTRAKLAWYAIDPTFYYGNNSETFPDADLSDPYTRQVTPNEVFPNQTRLTGDRLLRTFDLHYLPEERGIYNYAADPSYVDADGKFVVPEDNWAGIMRRTSSNTDFEAANFEFIEFWVMDPFLKNPDNGGEFYINLGQISEDVIPDNVRNFENGLPADPGNVEAVDSTSWARYPLTTPPTIAFNNEAEARQYQDVGLDGFRDEDELSFFESYLSTLEANFGRQSAAYVQASVDPSTDNYAYFRGDDYDNIGILKRYLGWNGQENNTPLNATQNGFSTQGSPNPNTEDLNLNGTLNTNEEYYEYKMNLRRSDMQIGKNYIVDVIEEEIRLIDNTLDTARWYQFRIPLTAGTPINNIQNFKAIEYIRMYLKGWEEEVVMRFARFQLVSTTWRTYRDYLGVETDTLITDPQPGNTFEIGTVNVEENASRQPFPYLMPPGIVRQQQVATTQPGLLQNEQSLVMKTCGLQDGDGRGAFKLTNFDMRSYKRLKMWIHAEHVAGNPQWADGDLRAFVRLGSDNSVNYYEYEIPLTASDPNGDLLDTLNIWANNLEFNLEDLAVAKAARNTANYPVINRFTFEQPGFLPDGHRIVVVGTPKISEVKTIMIGIRNENDGRGPICAEVWMNELRLVDFNEQPGWAANARVQVKLADFGNITASGSYRTPGFGTLEQRINNRSRETTSQWDVAGNFQLGKFFPKNWGIQLPLYVTYGEQEITPQFNPLEADVAVDNFLQSLEASARDTVLEALQDKRVNKSISLNNVRKVKVTPPGKVGPGRQKSFPWAIENFVLSASYNEVFVTGPRTKYNVQRSHRASIAYNYNFNSKPWEPFKNAKRRNPITEFNFNFLPKTIGITVSGDRRYEENLIRSTANNIPIQPTYLKNFQLSRTYNLRWDFTKSLSLTYNAVNSGRVDEPFGQLTEANQDSLWDNFLSFGPERDTSGLYQLGRDKQVNFGRNMNFSQNIAVNYILPFDKFKPTSWISSTVSYNGTFNWLSAPDNNLELGNQINNGQNVQGNLRFNMDNLYNKIGFLRKLLESQKPPARPNPRNTQRKNPKEKEETKEGEEEEGEEEEKGPSAFGKIAKSFGQLLLGVRNIDLTYSRNMSNSVSGYLPQTDNFGLDWNHAYRDARTNNLVNSSEIAPGYPYVFGWQPNEFNELDDNVNFLNDWSENGWISDSPDLLTPFSASMNEQITARTSVQLFKDFKVDLNATRSNTQNYSEIFRYDELSEDFVHDNRLLNGAYSMSYVFIGTAFEKNEAESKTFLTLQDVRTDISQQLAEDNPFYDNFLNLAGISPDSVIVEGGYAQGYYRNSQEVVIPAFRAAYTGREVTEETKLTAFPAIPLPNWNINYNGLSKIESLKKHFKSVTIRHGYQGTYNVGGYTQNVRYRGTSNGFSDQFFEVAVLEDSTSVYNIESQYIIPSVSFSENFSPLAGVNMRFQNGLAANVDLKMRRQVSMSMTNVQLTEMRSKDFTVGLSYRKDRFEKSFNLFGRTINLQNQLNSRLDVTLRDTETRNRQLDQIGNSEVTAGNFQLIVRPSVDYSVNTKLNVRFYIEHSRNRPAISTSFPSSFTAVGFQVRFTLAN